MYSVGLGRAAKPAAPGKPVAYFDVNDPSPEDRQVIQAYAGRYRVEETSRAAGFSLARPRGEWIVPDVRLYRAIYDLSQPGKFLIAFVVDLDGHVVDLHVLESTDKHVADLLSQSLETRRIVPARLRGVPVRSIRAIRLSQPIVHGHMNRPGDNGLGVLGRGDR